jgi:hypothetical protein
MQRPNNNNATAQLCIWDAFGDFACKRPAAGAQMSTVFARPSKKPEWEMFTQPEDEKEERFAQEEERFAQRERFAQEEERFAQRERFAQKEERFLQEGFYEPGKQGNTEERAKIIQTLQQQVALRIKADKKEGFVNPSCGCHASVP